MDVMRYPRKRREMREQPLDEVERHDEQRLLQLTRTHLRAPSIHYQVTS